MPTGKPDFSARSSIKSTISLTFPNAVWYVGDKTSVCATTPLILAISTVFLAGRTPPFPGLAPCDSLISIAFTFPGYKSNTLALNTSKSKYSSSSPVILRQAIHCNMKHYISSFFDKVISHLHQCYGNIQP